MKIQCTIHFQFWVSLSREDALFFDCQITLHSNLVKCNLHVLSHLFLKGSIDGTILRSGTMIVESFENALQIPMWRVLEISTSNYSYGEVE